MNAPKIFVFCPEDKIFAPKDHAGNIYADFEEHGCVLIKGDEAWLEANPDNEAAMAAMADGSMAMMGGSLRNSPISRKVIEGAGRPRILAKYSIGVDDVDVEAATALGILVTHSPTEANWGGVAEGTVANMLTMLKKVRERDRYLKVDKGWKDKSLEGTFIGRREDGYPGITIGIVGLGRIGGRIAKLMRPWEARILACDPYVPDEKFAALGVERVDFDTILAESDVVSLHVTLTKETRHMFSTAQFERMKRSAIFINTARGFCVDEQALIDALQRDLIAGAAIDAFEYEPVAEDSPLRAMGDKVLLSPHMISATVGAGLHQGIEWAHRSVLAALRGEVPDCVYNKEVIPRWLAEYGGKNVFEELQAKK